MNTEEKILTRPKTPPREDRETPAPKLGTAIHRRILNFINDAVQPEDLVYEKMTAAHDEGNPVHEDNPEELMAKRKKILNPEAAKEIIEQRDRAYPLGFRNLKEVLDITRLDRNIFDTLLHHFSDMFFQQAVKESFVAVLQRD